jgi:hypothetical protein
VKPRSSRALWPSLFVTTTSTLPALPGGAVAVIAVSLATLTDAAAVVPKDTVAPVENPVPAIDTLVPPAAGPELGPTEDTVGAGLAGVSYRKPFDSRALCPSGFVTTTSAMPADLDGVVAVIDVALTTATLDAAEPPIETEAPATNPLPLIVTARPPPVAPRPGVTPDTVGAGADDAGGCGDEGPDGDEPPPQEIVSIVRVAHAAKVASVL